MDINKQPYWIIFAVVLAVLTLPVSLSAENLTELPSVIIQMPENGNAIVVEKKTQTLLVYTVENGRLKLKVKFPCSTGEVGGIKQKAGDRKTPEGIYFLIDAYEDKYLSPIYGKKAFPTDYPNLIDRQKGRNGSAIWIHGTNKKLVPMDSNGCIALENHNILKLEQYVQLHSTPVIMSEVIETASAQSLEEVKTAVTNLIDSWIQAQEEGSYHDYLAHYDNSYLPDISWWKEWQVVRKKIETIKHKKIDLTVDKLGIYQQTAIVVALFDVTLKNSNENVLVGTRKLFLKKSGSGYRIIGDGFQKVASNYDTSDSFPMLAAVNATIFPFKQNEKIIQTVKEWMAAWSKKDMDAYASFYADSFYSDRMNKRQWVRRKKAIARKYSYIHVTGRDFKVIKKKRSYEVVFFQMYESSGLTTEGTKRLKLINKGGLWKIFQESWKER